MFVNFSRLRFDAYPSLILVFEEAPLRTHGNNSSYVTYQRSEDSQDGITIDITVFLINVIQ